MTAPLDSGSIRLQVGYDGPALTAGRMDVRILAGAMASVAQLIDDATRVVYGTDAGVRVEVSGDFRRGSFAYQIITTALAGLTADQVKEILVWLGLISAPTGITVIGLLKLLNGKKIERVERQPDSTNTARIVAGDQSTIVNLQVAQLVVNHTVRADLEGVTQPLQETGIKVLRTGEADKPPATEINQEERRAFLAPPPKSEELHDQVSEAVLQLVSPVFRIGNKWQFAYPGEAAFFAPILDKAFLERLQRRQVTFSFGDLVRVTLRTVITRTEDGAPSTTREILEVLEIIPPSRLQTDLFT